MPYLKRQALCPEPIDCKILTAALNLFVKKGYHNVSIHEIQKEADVSIGSIYRHFNGKEGVAKALYKHILNELDELIDGVITTIEIPTQQIKEIIKQLFEHTETHPEIISYIFHTKHVEFLPNEPLMCDATPFNRIKNIIKLAINSDKSTEIELQIDSSLIMGSVTKLIQLRLDGLAKKPLAESLDILLAKLWHGLEEDIKIQNIEK
ncbi:MAG: TetR/AcrR family transcriptional regulator [Thiotrichaceae bacterium]|nr:TetR/AcrR family transcriptional regulator [Thiotrichaceae bacterium]